jgi:ankyrin repeat protein
VGVN